MKQRFSCLDLRAIANELNSKISNSFVQNFYSHNQKTIYIKFSSKDVLMIESGYKIYLTESHETEISHFCKKLREYCRHTRVISVKQVGWDRILVIDVNRYRLVIEFFSGGNIIIIDHEDTIIDLLRPVPEMNISKGNKYIFKPFEFDFDKFFKGEGDEPFFGDKELQSYFEVQFMKKFNRDFREFDDKSTIANFATSFVKDMESISGLGEITLIKGKPEKLLPYRSNSEENSTLNIQSAGCINKLSTVDIKTSSLPEEQTTNEFLGDSSKSVNSTEKIAEITAENNDLSNDISKLKIENRIVIEFADKTKVNELLNAKKGIKSLIFSSFNAACEFYYTDFKKVKKVKEDKETRIKKAQEKYIYELENQACDLKDIAEVLTANREFLEPIFVIFKKVFGSKMEWSSFEAFYESEKMKGNPYANAITCYNLADKTCIVSLDDRQVELDLSLTLNQNIEKYYNKKKKADDKGRKTKVALENVLQKITPKKAVFPVLKREPLWFEKFNFFICPDKTLVIGGKTAQQNDMIVKKYLEKDDIYMHCDIHGGSSVICKSRNETAIEYASYMALVNSKCWTEGVIKPVFYVEPDQVSKTAPSGEFLSTGSFVIKGKKNIAHPYRLEYGIGLIFKLQNATDILDFSSNPTEDDDIVYAMVVAAPWSIVKDYKYKARICPGNEKKSKVVESIQSLFNRESENKKEERNVKGIGIEEYQSVILTKCKIAKIVK